MTTVMTSSNDTTSSNLASLFWLLIRLFGVTVILFVIFVIFIISGSISAMSEMEPPALPSDYESLDIEERCQNEGECVFDNVKPSGNPVKNACITASYVDRRPWGLHGAVDFVGNHTVRATHDGIVDIEIFKAGSCKLGGSTYSYGAYPNIIVSNDEYSTEYLHMVDIQVRSGQEVHRGDVLGTMGNEGCSTGTHLHYEVHKKSDGIWSKENPEHGYIDASHC